MSSTQSVCIINEFSSFGGQELHTVNLVKALMKHYTEVELIACGGAEYGPRLKRANFSQNVKIIHTDLRINNGMITSAIRWLLILRRLRSKMVILSKGGPDVGSVGFLLACKWAFNTIIFIEHLDAHKLPNRTSRLWFGILPGLGFWWFRLKIRRELRWRFADRVIAVSKSVRQTMTEIAGYPPSKVRVIHNGVDIDKFTRRTDSGNRFRARHSIPPNAFVFGMMARLSNEKGIDIAFRAIQRVNQHARNNPAYLMVCGEGPDLEALTTLRKELHIEEWTRITGFVEQVVDALSAFDFILFSSRVEGLPLGLLEGMSAGCVPVVTRVGGMPEVVCDRKLGWVVDPEDPEALSIAMEDAMQLDGPKIAAMRRNARTRIMEEFNLNTTHQQYIGMLEDEIR